MSEQRACPCDSGRSYTSCCEPLIAGGKNAGGAEALMRSRYTANVLKEVDYLLKTWHASTRPAEISPDSIPEWQGLQIIRVEKGRENDLRGVVEFKADALLGKERRTLHEVSRFVKENGRWLYMDGDQRDSPPPPRKKVGRNAPCPCGSGKKYKKCHGK
ncbi:MAG: hypothetical protein GY859_30555 [Desulfobacterales bacterium]|nr:hypothetical protein [Desulfobacterales bacterium]